MLKICQKPNENQYLYLMNAILTIVLLSLTLTPNGMSKELTRLKSCPKSPNCVCTQDEIKKKQMQPLTFTSHADQAEEKLKNLINKLGQATLISSEGNYYHYTFITKIGKFTDDVEFLIVPETKLIHFRSASRTGYGDFGKNKRRIKKIQNLWNTAINETEPR